MAASEAMLLSWRVSPLLFFWMAAEVAPAQRGEEWGNGRDLTRRCLLPQASEEDSPDSF